MNQLNQNGMQELSAAELQNIEGGIVWRTLLQAGITLLIREWDSTKQAAVDAWNGEYNPPQ